MSITDEEVFSTFPLTDINRDNVEFYRGLLQHQLLINRCAECGTWHNPPRPICPNCWSFNVTATAVSGYATAYLVRHQFPRGQGVESSEPYPVVTVELAEQEGLRFTSTMLNGANVEIDDRLRVTWTEEQGAPYPVFESDTEERR